MSLAEVNPQLFGQGKSRKRVFSAGEIEAVG
jgi:hypothetical protein